MRWKLTQHSPRARPVLALLPEGTECHHDPVPVPKKGRERQRTSVEGEEGTGRACRGSDDWLGFQTVSPRVSCEEVLPESSV